MFTTAQQQYLLELGILFNRLESLFSLQQLEQFRYTFFTLHQREQFSDDEQHLRSLERERRYRAEKLKQGF